MSSARRCTCHRSSSTGATSPAEPTCIPWAFQCSSYLLAGPPFTADTISTLIGKIATEAPPNIMNVRPDLPEAVAAVVMKAIQKPLDMRFATGDEMAEALGRARASEWGDTVDVDEAELAEMTRKLEFFEDFSDNELEQVLDCATWRHFSAYEQMVTEGAQDRSLYVLVTGEARVRISDQPISTLRAGDCAGELAFLSGEPRSATVVAEQDVWALEIEEPLAEWASMPVQLRFTRTFEKVLARRLRQTSRDLAASIG